MKRGGPLHPKVMALAVALGVARYTAVGLLECLWHFTAQYAPRGDLGKFSDAEIEQHLGWDGEPGRLMHGLLMARLLDTSEAHRLVVHDWHEHADQGVRNKLLKDRTSFATCTKRRTPGRTLCPTGGRQGKGKGKGNGKGSSSSESLGGSGGSAESPPRTAAELTAAFETSFWPIYPPRNGRRDGKSDALAEWLKLKPDRALEAAILAALPAYARSTDLPVDACRWLKRQRWLDDVDARPTKPMGSTVREMAAQFRAELAVAQGGKA